MVADGGECEAGGVGGRAAVDAADGLRAARQGLQIGDAAVSLELAERNVVHGKPEEGALEGRHHKSTTPLARYSDIYGVNSPSRDPVTVPIDPRHRGRSCPRR